uniref:Uncharacterized protein n=1 Tax=Oryza meridionalis TaxID=40149 RepID=A0A0E0FBS5_9ORYZ
MELVCKHNPNSIIKCQKPSSHSATSSTTSYPRGLGSSTSTPRGVVQRMTAYPLPCQQFTHNYPPPPLPGQFWSMPQSLAPRTPLQLPAPPMFAKRADLFSQEVSRSVQVSSPGGIISSSVVCLGCGISIDGEEFVANLIMVPLPLFDVILEDYYLGSSIRRGDDFRRKRVSAFSFRDGNVWRVPTLELSRSIEEIKASTRWTCMMDKLCCFVSFIYPIIFRSFLLSIVWVVLCYIFIFHFMFKFTTLFMFYSSGCFCLHYSSTMRSHGSAIWIFIHDP